MAKSGVEPQEPTAAPTEQGASGATDVAEQMRAPEKPGPPKQQQQQQLGETTPRPAAVSVSDKDAAAAAESGGSSPAAVPSWAAPDIRSSP